MDIKDIILSKCHGYRMPQAGAFTQEELDEIWAVTDFLPPDYPFITRAKYIINGFTEHRRCPICDNKLKDNNRSDLQKFCSKHCICKYTANNEAAKARRAKTCQRKYGAKNVAQIPEFHKKSIVTKQRLYSNKQGVTCPHKSEFVIERLYSYDWMKDAFEKHGVNWICDYLQCSLSLVHRLLNRFNIKTKKPRATITPEQIQVLTNHQWLKDAFENGENMKTIGQKIGVKYCTVYRRCRKHPSFTPNNNSAFEERVCQWLDDMGVSYQRKNRKLLYPSEIDIYIPDARLAIEVDGVYWHSQNAGKGSEYHINKTRRCEEQGIQLLHLFDFDDMEEWQLHIGKLITRFPFVFNEQIITLDRRYYSPIKRPVGYALKEETHPVQIHWGYYSSTQADHVVIRVDEKDAIDSIWDCGQLIYERVE